MARTSAVDDGAPYATMYADFKKMGAGDAAKQVLRDGLYVNPSSIQLLELAVREGVEVAEEVGAQYARNHAEFTEMGCHEAAKAVLRQGLVLHPHSALLLELARRERRAMREARKLQPRIIRPAPPPHLPEPLPARKKALVKKPPIYSDEGEYPDVSKATRAARIAAFAGVVGVIISQAELLRATWFVWTFLAIHLVGVIFLTDYARESGLYGLCAIFGLHAGHAISEFVQWALARDGDDSLGPWAALMGFACFLYLHSFWMECRTLPPDYITSLSMFFTMFPAFNAAVAMSCVEFYLEWRYLPDYKLWTPGIVLGVALMAAGQTLICSATRTADRNFWASCRNCPEDDPNPEDFVGLEIPDRRIVNEGPYRWERHPSYLGALLWGVGAEIALCNPVMFLLVGFVLWATLLHITLEEEKELYEEFEEGYSRFATVTRSWIPLFNSFLEAAAFQRQMAAISEAQKDEVNTSDDSEEEPEEEDEDEEEEDDEEEAEEDDLLPTWEGVPKGGALWNRQFREPWRLG